MKGPNSNCQEEPGGAHQEDHRGQAHDEEGRNEADGQEGHRQEDDQARTREAHRQEDDGAQDDGTQDAGTQDTGPQDDGPQAHEPEGRLAMAICDHCGNDYDKAFQEIDVLASPASPNPPSKIGEYSANPLAMYLEDIYTIGANLAGLPGISLPAGFTAAGLPVGLQLLAAPFEEEKLLRAARMYEQATQWQGRRATL